MEAGLCDAEASDRGGCVDSDEKQRDRAVFTQGWEQGFRAGHEHDELRLFDREESNTLTIHCQTCDRDWDLPDFPTTK